MPRSEIIAQFVTEADAWRATTMLRAAGIPDSCMTIVEEGSMELGRDDEVGVPDSSAGLSGLRTDEPAPRPVVLLRITGLERARVDEAELEALIESAGGSTQDN
jgi:hypothetical protein